MQSEVQLLGKEEFQAKLAALIQQEVSEPSQHMGRPRESLRDMVWCCVYKAYSARSTRTVISDLVEAKVKGYIQRVPHYNTILHYLDDPVLMEVLQHLLASYPVDNRTHFEEMDEAKVSLRSKGERGRINERLCQELCKHLSLPKVASAAMRKFEWHDALIKSPFQPGDHCVWLSTIYANDGTGRTTLEATFVQIVPWDGPLREGDHSIIYRMPDYVGKENWEKEKQRKQQAMAYVKRVYGEPLSPGWYLCDDPMLINEATYHDWEQQQEWDRQRALRTRSGRLRKSSKE